MSPTIDIDFRVLGPLEVVIAGKAADLGGAKPRKLLAALLVNANRVLSADTLVEELWEGEPPPTAHKSVQKFVSALRKDLGEVLVTRESGYMVDVDDLSIDSGRLAAAVRRARSGARGWENAMAEAVASWRGEPYPDLEDTTWGPPERARLLELLTEAEELLVDRQIGRGGYHDAVARLEALVARFPYHEPFWGRLMIALYRSGRQRDALEAYRRLKAVLADDLGIDPSPAISRIEEQILLQDPVLLGPALARSDHNLPESLTSFIGRHKEISEIVDLTSNHRLVTLVGPAGSGKTRLAVEVGRALGDFGGGVWFVDLAPVSSPDQVVDSIAKPLGVGHLADRPAVEVIADYLRDRSFVLILDNCEHLISRVAAVTDHILRVSPGVVVVATSRERLGISGEVVYEVPPLPYPETADQANEEFDAVRLFIERARALSRDDVADVDWPIVGEIVTGLDGMPLALELAAARVRALGLVELRNRLDDRFDLLTSPSHSAQERHQTLAAALDWSYQLLDEDEQSLFRRLSVFRGGFDLGSATSVCGYAPLTERMVPELLSELIDKSLVSVGVDGEGRRRYSLLESLREFGGMQLGSGETSELRDSHASHFLGLAEEAARHLSGPDQTRWLAVLRSEHDNLRRALRWAATTSTEMTVRMATALGGFWDSVGPRAEGHEWLRRAVEMGAGLPTTLRIPVLLGASTIFSSAHASLPKRYAEEALALARETGDRLGEARALRTLSWALALDEHPEDAREKGMEALAIFEDHDDPWEVAHTLERLAQSGYGDPDWSIGVLKRANDIYRQVGDRTREALSLYKMADRLAGGLGDVERAREYAERALAICEELGNANDIAHAGLELGKVLRRAGEHDRAAHVLQDALTQLTKSGDERCSVRALTALGTTKVEAGDFEAAEAALRESLTRGRELNEKHTTRVALAGLARLQAIAGRDEEAVTLLGFVDELNRELGVPASDLSTERREARVEPLRESLGDGFDPAWERGRNMTLTEAVDLALHIPVG